MNHDKHKAMLNKLAPYFEKVSATAERHCREDVYCLERTILPAHTPPPDHPSGQWMESASEGVDGWLAAAVFLPSAGRADNAVLQADNAEPLSASRFVQG